MSIDILLKDLTLHIGDSVASIDNKESFLALVKKLKYSRKVRFIYRGDENLHKHYNADLDNVPLLSQHIFMLGEKGNLFLTRKIEEYDNVYKLLSVGDIQDGIVDKSLLQTIKDTGRYERYLIKNNDILVSSKSTKIKVGRVEIDEKGVKAA